MPWRIKFAMRYVTTRVLPVPAPARTSNGPLNVETASRCAGFNPSPPRGSVPDIVNKHHDDQGTSTVTIRPPLRSNSSASPGRSLRFAIPTSFDLLAHLRLTIPFADRVQQGNHARTATLKRCERLSVKVKFSSVMRSAKSWQLTPSRR